MKFFKILYNSFIWGLMAALLAFQNQWLEMRMNVGLIIPVVMLVVIAVFYAVPKSRKNSLYFNFEFINLISCGSLAFVILGFKRLTVLPAAIIRELLKLTGVSFDVFNTILLIAIIGGILAIAAFDWFKYGKEAFYMKPKKSTLYKILALVSISLIYMFVPGVKGTTNKVVKMFSTVDIGSMKVYIKSFGLLAPVVSIVLMMFQSIVAPLPAFVITFANAWIFGWAWGAVISWSGAMLGAALCFYISRFYGRPAAEKFVGKKGLDMADGFFKKYGQYAILIARLLPFVSFDIVSYAAGLTEMSFWSFFWATGLGQLPATIVYSLLGQNMDRASKLGLWIVCGVAALIAFALAIKSFLTDKKKKEISG